MLLQSSRPLNTKANAQTARVIVIDDDDSVSLFFKIALEINGYAVDVFNDPTDALSYIKNTKQDYCLLIIDIKMPKMDGFEFYEKAEAILVNQGKRVPRACFLTALEMTVKEQYENKLSNWKEMPLFIRKPISAVALSKLASELTASTKPSTPLTLTETYQMRDPVSCRHCGALLDDKPQFPFAKAELLDDKEYFCNNPECGQY